MGLLDTVRSAAGRRAEPAGTRVRAVWRGAVLAESDDTLVVEGNHYFPEAALRRDHLRPSERTSVCPWKGTASYFDVVVGDETNPAAAWTYPATKEAAGAIEGRVAFWKGVAVEPAG